jgi:ParB/RepB/Spo0J family partition protein
MLDVAQVEHLRLDALDLEDTTFRFRAALRLGPLRDSIAAEGQQLPVVVRKLSARVKPYQIISGFRRATAMAELGTSTIAAIVREDLEDDEAAFRASVLENSQRRTYTDIDRALVIKSYEDRGYGSADTAALMGLSKRQKNNLRGLLDLPRTVRDAIDEPGTPFTATHGLILKQLKRRYRALHYATWVRAVTRGNDGSGLSVSQLKREVNARYRAASNEGSVRSIFRTANIRSQEGVYRLQPLKIEPATLSDEERAALKGELSALLAALG